MKKAASYVFTYLLWILGFRLVALTIITWVLMSSGAKFQEISDTSAANEMIVVGLGSLLFVCVLRWLNPLTSTTTEEIFSPYRFEKRFAPGFLQGATLAVGLTLAFLLSGVYRYLGFFIQSDSTPLAIVGVFVRVLAVVAMVYCEGFIFNHKILNHLRNHLTDIQSILIVAAAWCLVKTFQFHLGFMHFITLLLISLCMGFRTVAEGDFCKSAGLLAGLLIVFHPLLSLPVLGNEAQGVVLIKYQIGSDADLGIIRYLTGGSGGPLSSLALQVLLAIDVIQSVLKNKKLTFHPVEL